VRHLIEPCRFLERLGAPVTYLPVDGTGRIGPDELRRAVTPSTVLVSIMHANNEVGTIQPIEDCARIAHERGVLLHTDAAQSVGKVPYRHQRTRRRSSIDRRPQDLCT
jgi:cysteine desulfurase